MEPCLATINPVRMLFIIERLNTSRASTCIQAVFIHSKQKHNLLCALCMAHRLAPVRYSSMQWSTCCWEKKICRTHIWKLWSWDANIQLNMSIWTVFLTNSPVWKWNGFHLCSYSSWRWKWQTICEEFNEVSFILTVLWYACHQFDKHYIIVALRWHIGTDEHQNSLYGVCIHVSGHSPGPRLNIKTVLSTYGDFHVKDKTAVRTSYL